MAKKPQDPLPQPDDQNNPKKKKAQPAVPEDSDSAIDFGTPHQGELSSDISVIEWASLVEEPQPESGSQPKVDSPSDADLFAQMSDQPVTPVSEEDVAELLAEADFQFEDEPAPAPAPARPETQLAPVP